ncbi:MAG: SusC/RagA family TonB-linked outer membrane protein [Gemmatimonadetes bacterium]|nr:SusC/RagA family TonB-linked outer membrane protein [Gemmatimonadota bacterium]
MPTRFVRVLLAGAVTLALFAGGASTALAQGTVISGRVLSDGGTPLVGATLTLGAAEVATVSRADGTYRLQVPAGRSGAAQLTARRLGFKLLQQPINISGAAMTMDFTLVPTATQLVGVTVTALGILAEKATVGTSQQTVSSADLTRTVTPSIISSLSGKVSGVQINQSGNMGGSSRIVIRGAGSILGENQPLFIVDGIPVSNAGFSTASAGGGRDYGSAVADLNPDDIAEVTVLKGPNAAALYGSRATNGAVVITTKSGRGSSVLDGVKFNFTTRISSDAPSIMPKYQNRYGQGFGGDFKYVDGAGSGVNDGADESWGPMLDGRLIDQFFGKAQPWIAHPNNVKDYFQSGSTVSNNLNMVSSGKATGSRLSITKEDVKGLVPNSSIAKLAGSLSANAVVNSKLTLSGSAQYTQTKGMNRPENGYTEGNPFMTFTWFGRQVDVGMLKNKYYNTSSPYGFSDGSLFNWNDNYHRNPYWQQYDNAAPDSREHIIGQLTANYAFTPWLSGLLRTGMDSYRQTQEEHFAAGNIDRADPSFNGGFTSSTARAQETNFEGIVTARKTLGKFDFTVNGGGNIRRNDRNAAAFSTSGILVEGIYNLSNAGIAPTFTNSESHSAVNSVYGSAIATYDRWWTVEVTGRNDYSSTLPKQNSSYFYPSINTSIVLSDKFPAITHNPVLSSLKLRAGYAKVGSDAGPYQLRTLYNGSSNKFSGLPLYSLSNTSANPNLKPERTTSTEGGVEFALFDDRITVDATYFLKTTRDQIIPLTIAPATGFTATTINAGQISNRGFEAMVSARVFKLANGFQWTTSLNYSAVKNKVDELAPGLATIIVGSQWGTNIEARAGQPYGAIFGYGFKRDSATHQLLLSGGFPQRATAKQVLGNVNPDWNGGWSNEFHYRNYSLSFLIDMQHGGQTFSIGNWWGNYAGILDNTLKGREVDWDKPGLTVKGIDQATGKANTTVITAEDYQHSIYPIVEPAILSTGFAKLREMRLAYEVPSTMTARLKLSQMNIALVGRNLYTWTSFPNYDPEYTANSGNAGKGFEMGALPSMRSIGFNIAITP